MHIYAIGYKSTRGVSYKHGWGGISMEVYEGFFRALSLVIVWAIPASLIIAVGAFVVSAPALALGGLALRLYSIASFRMHRKSQTKPMGLNVACSIDADCPSGFVCLNGICVPKQG